MQSVEKDAGDRSGASSHWYGWQVLLADGSALALLLFGTSVESPGGVYLGAATFVLGGPIAHIAHRRGGAAAGSLALRLGAPVSGLITGILVGAALSRGGRNHVGTSLDDAGLAGGLLGLLVAAGVDIAVLARERVESAVPWTNDDQRMHALAGEPALLVAPVFVPRQGGGFAGVQVVF